MDLLVCVALCKSTDFWALQKSFKTWRGKKKSFCDLCPSEPFRLVCSLSFDHISVTVMYVFQNTICLHTLRGSVTCLMILSALIIHDFFFKLLFISYDLPE